MKVTKAQAEANRAHVVETASRVFRERGFDGVGVADLMAAAGFTQGGFYKQFGSKVDLMAEAMACGIAQSTALVGEADGPAFLRHYLSREHRDDLATGCAMAALGGDAARQPDAVRTVFADSVENLVATLAQKGAPGGAEQVAEARARVIDVLAHVVGAVVLSRACPDASPLADEILDACRKAMLQEAPPPVRDRMAAPRKRRAA